jgi:protein-tyrosine phosphatase
LSFEIIFLNSLDAGQSRSASFLVGFIMSYFEIPLDEAMKIALAAREQISINKGFQEQLVLFEKNKFKITDEFLKQHIEKYQPMIVEWNGK